MSQRVRSRLFLEILLCVLSALALGFTALWPDWLEIVFHVEPDGGSGSAEWIIVVAAMAVFGASSTLATSELRRARGAMRTRAERPLSGQA
jgi:hypothetical protein